MLLTLVIYGATLACILTGVAAITSLVKNFAKLKNL